MVNRSAYSAFGTYPFIGEHAPGVVWLCHSYDADDDIVDSWLRQRCSLRRRRDRGGSGHAMEDRDGLFQLTVLAERDSDDMVVDCYDLDPDCGGMAASLRVFGTGLGVLSLQRSVPAGVVQRMLRLAQQRTGLLLDGDE